MEKRLRLYFLEMKKQDHYLGQMFQKEDINQKQVGLLLGLQF